MSTKTIAPAICSADSFRSRILSSAVLFAVAFSALASTAPAAELVNLTFDSSTDLTNNFRSLFSFSSTNSANKTPKVANGELEAAFDTSNILAYDTTPVDGTAKSTFGLGIGDTLTVSFDFSVATANSSIGVYFINPTSGESSAVNYLALYNIDSSGTSDRIRFSNDANPTNGSSTAGSLNQGNFLSSDAGTVLNSFASMTVTYTVDSASQVTLTMTSGSFHHLRHRPDRRGGRTALSGATLLGSPQARQSDHLQHRDSRTVHGGTADGTRRNGCVRPQPERPPSPVSVIHSGVPRADIRIDPQSARRQKPDGCRLRHQPHRRG